MVLVRGLPGSGKSTLAHEIYDEHTGPNIEIVVLSTDDLFYDSLQYHYLWNPEPLTMAHMLNQYKCKEAMLRCIDIVIIDNTNVCQEHMQPYIDMAKDYGYEIEIREPETPWAMDVKTCFQKCSHGVPIQGIQRMKDNWKKTSSINLNL